MAAVGESGLQEEVERLNVSAANGAEAPAQAPPLVRVRFRPAYLQTCKHDARGDALALVMERMAQKDIPLWKQYALGAEFISAHKDDLQTSEAAFVKDVYDAIDASVWCKRVAEAFDKFLASRPMTDDGDSATNGGIKPAAWDRFPFSLGCHRNRKPKMEDYHITLPSMAALDCGDPSSTKADAVGEMALFAVFDGHHGSEVAAYAAAHLHECLLKLAGEYDGLALLEKSLRLLDERVTLRCEKENIKSGATAACVLLENGQAGMAWCGDSAIGLLQPSGVTTLTRRHAPTEPDELKRIEEAGGIVVMIHGEARVNGVLNVSRSLGDIQAKPMISSTPELKDRRLETNDLALLLSSDGVWDQLTEESIFEAILEFIKSHSANDYEQLSAHVVERARESGAVDNLTFIVVFLHPVEEIWDKLANNQ